MMNQPAITWITADHPQLDQIIAMVFQATQHEATRCLQSAHDGDSIESIKAAWCAELTDRQLIIGTTGDAVLAAEFHLERAWLRGPFGNRAHAQTLWQSLIHQLPAQVTTYDAFPHLDAHELIIFWQSQGFSTVRAVHVMQHTDPIVDALTDGVHRANYTHRDAIEALHRRHFATAWASIDDLYTDDDQHLLNVMTTHDGMVKGYAWWSLDMFDHSATLEYIAVDDAFQRTGIATNLIYHGLAWAYSHHVHGVHLTVDDEKRGAQALYQRCGFRSKTSGQHLRWHTRTEADNV